VQWEVELISFEMAKVTFSYPHCSTLTFSCPHCTALTFSYPHCSTLTSLALPRRLLPSLLWGGVRL